MSTLFVAVPLYGSAELIGPLFRNLASQGPEFDALGAKLLLINDSPDCAELKGAIAAHLAELAASIDIQVVVNDANRGFVYSANVALELGRSHQCDVVLLNSDTFLTPGALREMAEVAATDPMISVVSPRSNNATLCNSPVPEVFRTLSREAAAEAHRRIQPLLPRVSYVPTAVGFCLYVRWRMIEEFGLFDPVYGAGYNEENDFILRCNRYGYRAVLANHAYVHHIGGRSFSQTDQGASERDKVNGIILRERYPHYDRSLARHFGGIRQAAERLLAGFAVPSDRRPGLVFDCRGMGTFHNGSFELAASVITAFCDRYGGAFDIFLCGHADALAFHGLEEIEGARGVIADLRATDWPPAYYVSLSGPYLREHVRDAVEVAPVTAFLMLDTIAYDCMALDDEDLGETLDLMSRTASVVGFISTFSRDQFRRRFPRPIQSVDPVVLCSTSADEYRRDAKPPQSDGSVLIVGNSYDHKFVNRTVELFLARGGGSRMNIVILGLELDGRPGVRSYASGTLDGDFVADLYAKAAVVLFPSHYEGFGFPILHALAQRRPVIVRDLPVFDEIAARTPYACNIHRFATTARMVEAAQNPPSWIDPTSSPVSQPQRWTDAADVLADALRDAEQTLNFDRLSSGLIAVREQPAALVPTAPAMGRSFRATSNLGMSPRSQSVSGRYAMATTNRIERWLNQSSSSPILRRIGPWLAKRTHLGRAAIVKVENMPAVLPPNSVGEIQAAIADDSLPLDRFVDAVLELSDALVVGGVLKLDLPSRTYGAPLDYATATGAVAWLESAGLEVESVELVGARLSITALKAISWSSVLPGPADDEQFVDAAFRYALGRPADGFGALHARNELASGRLRRDVLKHLLGSMERGLISLG